MPVPEGLLPVAGMVVAGMNNAANISSQVMTNAQSLAFSEYMYDKQRKDALSDWNMQNEYNSPAAQMQRLQEAGLNPHLVYGRGADNTSASVRSSQQGSSNLKAPHSDVQSLLLGSQLAVQQATARNIAAEAANKEFDLAYKEDARDSNLGLLGSKLDKLKADLAFTLDENKRRGTLNDANLKSIAQDILLKQEKVKQAPWVLKSLEFDTAVKQLEAQFAENGIRPGDPLWVRGLFSLLSKFLGKSVWDFLDGDFIPNIFK